MSSPSIVIEQLNHGYGEGALYRQILFDISAVVRSGEIIILSGPSGSGKTTLLTLIGALRSPQKGSLQVLGHELCGADTETLTLVRREIGYVFQAHNLLGALTAGQNVELGMQLHTELSAEDRHSRAAELLTQVGLEGFGDRHPEQMSGGQRQRVAVARALAGHPKILLADEPTASLDRKTGREIVSLIQKLARERKVTVIIVTHDPRILDVADRILSLEDGRLSSFMRAVQQDTEHMWGLLAQDISHGELVRRVRELDPQQFVTMLDQVTRETRDLIGMIEVAQSQTFDQMLGQVLDAFALKVGELLQADDSRVYMLDEEQDEFFSLGFGTHRDLRELRLQRSEGIAGKVAEEGVALTVEDVEQEGSHLSGVDLGKAGTRLLAMPLFDSTLKPFAVVELSRAPEAPPFSAQDAERLHELAEALATTLQTWFRMSCSCRRGRSIASRSCCEHDHPTGTPCPSGAEH